MFGKMFSHYKILEKLGEGGMGIVYKAKDTKLERIVALKLLPDRLNTNLSDKTRFMQEARAIAALNHPNVCVIYEIHEKGDTPFIAMEYVDGHTLNEIIKSNPNKKLSIEQSVDYSIQIGEALEEAHDKGIIHRDIKSENIMVNSKNQIKVMDFGLAKFKDALKLTNTSSMPGTLVYMAPEQIQHNDVDRRSDIYSFGVVLYEMLTGKLPFMGDYDASVMYSILNEEPKPLQEYIPNAPLELLYILNRILEKEPGDRYQSMTDLVKELELLQKPTNKMLGRSQLLNKSHTKKTLLPEKNKLKQRNIVWFSLVFLLAIISIYVLNNKEPEKFEINYQEMEIKRITTSGDIWETAVSSDGKYLAQVISEGNMTSIWLRQIGTNSNMQITDPENVYHTGLYFSSDGNYLYYTKRNKSSGVFGDLFKISILGGSSKLICKGISLNASISPDESQIAFVREFNKLFIANIDGSNEQLFIDYKNTNVGIKYASWSPDGEQIAFFYVQQEPSVKVTIKTLNIATKKDVTIKVTDWTFVRGLSWLPDGSGLIANVNDNTMINHQLWFVDYDSGDILRITNDLNTYVGVSLTGDGKSLATLERQITSNIWIQDIQNKNLINNISVNDIQRDGFLGISWAPDGKIVFSSKLHGDYDLWDMNPNGSERKQLTFYKENTRHPDVGNLNNTFIVLMLEDLNGDNIWRMDRDGGNLKQLTFDNSDNYPTITPDGKWIIYNTRTVQNAGLMKIPIDGGEPESIIKGQMGQASVSPDGKLIAFRFFNEQNQELTGIISIDGGQIIRTFKNQQSPIEWGAKGQYIYYIKNNDQGGGNIWRQPLDGDSSRQITFFEDSKVIRYFDLEPNGKRLVIVRSKYFSNAVLLSNFRK